MQLIYCLFPNQQEAEEVVGVLLEERLIACANLLPGVTSFFVWEGTVQNANEVAVLFKTTEAAAPQVEAVIKSRHTYVCPCILRVQVEEVETAYAQWVQESVKDAIPTTKGRS